MIIFECRKIGRRSC